MGGAPTSRVIMHSMWISVLVTLPTVFVEMYAFNALDHDPDFGRGLDSAVVAMLLFVPFWVPPVVLDAVLIGLAAAGSDRVFRGRVAAFRVWSATVAGALAGGVTAAGWVLGLSPYSLYGLLEPGSGLVVLVVTGAVTGAIGGGGGLSLAARFGRIEAATPWVVAAVAAGAVAAVIAIYLSLYAHPWYPEGECASRLESGVDAASFVDVGFPPQVWCVSLDTVQKWGGSELDGIFWLAAAVSVACVIIAVDGGWGASRRPTVGVLVTAGATVIAGLGLAIWTVNASPSAAQIEQARTDIHTRIRPMPSVPPPAIPADQARADQQRLVQLARASVGKEVLWPKGPHTSAEACTLASGGAGVMISSTAQFTTRLLADVHGADEMYALEHANEKVAAQIADAWSASGMAGDAEMIHREWWFGGKPSTSIETAHLGFTNGIGELRISSYCARR